MYVISFIMSSEVAEMWNIFTGVGIFGTISMNTFRKGCTICCICISCLVALYMMCCIAHE